VRGGGDAQVLLWGMEKFDVDRKEAEDKHLVHSEVKAVEDVSGEQSRRKKAERYRLLSVTFQVVILFLYVICVLAVAVSFRIVRDSYSQGPLTRNEVIAFALLDCLRIICCDRIGGLLLGQCASIDHYILIRSQRDNWR
jgi:hypothetical protein